MNKNLIKQGVILLLQGIGEDSLREGLIGTPDRVANMWEDFLVKHNVEVKTFTNEQYDEMIIVRNIPFYSFCEHHILPYFGGAAIGYLPNGRVLGLSKLARILDKRALRLTIQEDLTVNVAKDIQGATEARGVGVVLQAEHLCMAMRGVQKQGTKTVTSAMFGLFREDLNVKQEFLTLIRGSM